jgi:hypothetical protein
MHNLTSSYVPETGEVILDGTPAGPAGEAMLAPATGAELAFDRADGHLVRAIVNITDASAMALVCRLFGANAEEALHDLAKTGGAVPQAMSSARELSAALSNLARLDAIRATSPAPASSPWWAAEAAVLAEQAGLRSRTLAEAARASCGLCGSQTHRSCVPGVDVAAEVRELANDSLPGLHWVLDAGIAPPKFFRPGLTPHSDLFAHHDTGGDYMTVRATLALGADPATARRWHARLVDPKRRLVLDHAAFKLAGSEVQAQLRFPVDEPDETWIEVVDDPGRPVRSAKAHRIRRALRWADAALRAERAPEGIAPWSTPADWAALATLAWEQCRLDWEAAGDYNRAAAVLAPRMPVPGPVCLAEILGE